MEPSASTRGPSTSRPTASSRRSDSQHRGSSSSGPSTLQSDPFVDGDESGAAPTLARWTVTAFSNTSPLAAARRDIRSSSASPDTPAPENRLWPAIWRIHSPVRCDFAATTSSIRPVRISDPRTGTAWTGPVSSQKSWNRCATSGPARSAASTGPHAPWQIPSPSHAPISSSSTSSASCTLKHFRTSTSGSGATSRSTSPPGEASPETGRSAETMKTCGTTSGSRTSATSIGASRRASAPNSSTNPILHCRQTPVPRDEEQP